MPRRKANGREYIEFGKRVRSLRKALGWSQVDMAEHASLSPSYLAELERGGRNPSLETILNLAAALNVNSGYLVDGLRYDPPAGLETVAETWPSMSDDKRALVLQLVSVLVSDSSTFGNIPRNRPKTSA